MNITTNINNINNEEKTKNWFAQLKRLKPLYENNVDAIFEQAIIHQQEIIMKQKQYNKLVRKKRYFDLFK
jgi:spore coat protein CotH